MVTLYFTLLAAMMLLCTGGIALGFGLGLPRPWVTLATGPWVVALMLFGIESVVPLGRPGIYLGVSLCLISAWLFAEVTNTCQFLPKWLSEPRLREWKAQYRLGNLTWKGNRPQVTVFPFGGILLALTGTFSYAALWRFTFANIDGSSEKISDLMYITSYLAGTGVPAQDYWFAPFSSDHYYSLQHYAAALLGRAFNLSPGMTYNYAFCLLIALTATTGLSAIATFNRTITARVVCGSALLIGGSGLSGLIHLLVKNVDIWSSMRFIGSVQCDLAPLGTWLQSYADGHKKLDLPSEPLAYSVYLGDYHPPLSGLYLLFIALLLLGQYHLRPEQPGRNGLLFLLGGTVPLCIVSNLWSLPLQGLLVGSWLGYRAFNRKLQRREIFALTVGGLASVVPLLGYLSRFILSLQESDTYFKIVGRDDHTPPLLFVLFLFPTLATILLSFFCRKRPLVWVTLFWLGLIVFSEFIYIKDIYGGPYERFNSALKWWPWIDAGVICSLAPLALAHSRAKWQMYALYVAIGYPCLFAYDLGTCWYLTPKLAPGAITGDAFLMEDQAAKALYNQLKQLPVGLTIERPDDMAYTNTTALSLLAGKPCWLGWCAHEQLWRNYAPEILQRYDRLNEFYDGKCTNTDWLMGSHIEYILWFKPKDTEALRASIAPSLAGKYFWMETLKCKDTSSGYWVRIH